VKSGIEAGRDKEVSTEADKRFHVISPPFPLVFGSRNRCHLPQVRYSFK
jgi:hypothetical protein